jgi:hypothetical protein
VCGVSECDREGVLRGGDDPELGPKGDMRNTVCLDHLFSLFNVRKYKCPLPFIRSAVLAVWKC